MDKQQIIAFIEGQLATGKISKSDILSLVNDGMSQPQSQQTPSAPFVEVKAEVDSKSLINTFYGIGAIIAVVGVGILVAQNWSEIGFMGRIMVTLGISLVTYFAALLLNKPHQNAVSQVMFAVSAALAPLGSYVMLSEAGVVYDTTSQIITALILAVIFGTALFVSKKNVLVLITVAYVSWAYYAFIFKIFDVGSSGDADIIKWASMLLGASYIFISYGYLSLADAVDENDVKEKKSVQNVLNALGTLAILGAGIFVGGMFDLIFIALIFAAFYGSVYLKSRSMLILGAIFLMFHIIKLTSKYFAGSVGWPVLLIIVGFMVIGVGYMTFYLNKKFIS